MTIDATWGFRASGEGDGVGGNGPKEDRSPNAGEYAGFCRVSTPPYVGYKIELLTINVA